MAITGTGTEQDPFIVHSYEEFISLSGSGHDAGVRDHKVYIQFFEDNHPNQTIDCNSYGSEFKWGTFTDNSGYYGTVTIYINLNGCTIKNFLIADGVSMFEGHYWSISGAVGKIVVSNGSFRNVFMGSATSKFCGNYVEFHDVSISINISGTTVTTFSGSDTVFDNCAIYLVASTLYANPFYYINLSDTDMEIHVSNLNSYYIFSRCTITDCRIQGTVTGNICDVGGHNYAILCYNYGSGNPDSVMTNCVVDMSALGTKANWMGSALHFYLTGNGTTLNTNVFCNSHGLPEGYHFPNVWNYMSHENIRNGTYLNNAGFTVVEVAGG